MDNADDIDLWTSPLTSKAEAKRLIDYMPRSRHGAIIWTTRDRKVATQVARETVTVQQMDESRALDMMRNYLMYPDRIEHDMCLLPGLLRKLTYLPLAIVQATAYLNETGESLKTYEALLSNQDDELIELLSEHFEDDGRYTDTENAVAKTWLISFEQIRRRSSLAFEYLGLMACVDPKGIPRSLLPLSERATLKQQTDAIGILDAFSFITRHEGGLAFDLHRLVHLATRGWLKRNGELSTCHEKVVVRLNELLPNIEETNRMDWRVYVAHAQYAVGRDGNYSEEEANLAEKCGDCLDFDFRYREAEKLYHRVLKYRETVLGPEHPDTFISVSVLGTVLTVQGKYEEAEAMHRRDLEGSERVLGSEHPETLTSASNIASVLTYQGRYEEAEVMHRRVLQDRERVLGPDHRDTLSSFDQLGSFLVDQGRYEEAEAMYQRALEGLEALLGPEHPDTLYCVGDLGLVHENLGNHREAEAMYRCAFEGLEKIRGSEHPDTLVHISYLGSLLENQGKYDEAEVMHRRALEVSEKVLGPEHPSTLVYIGTLALSLDRQGQYGEAEAMYRQAIEGSEKVIGLEHPNTLNNISNLGTLLDSQGRSDEAETMHRRVLKGTEKLWKVLEPEHPDMLTSVRNLCSCLDSQGKYEEGKAIRQRKP